MKRRTFLRLAGAAAAPFIIPSRVLGRNAPSSRLNVGFIGAGGISGGHRDFVLQQDNLQITWICDVDANHRNAALKQAADKYAGRDGASSYNGVKSTDDLREVIADRDVDIIWNCTPDHWHALSAVLAAQAGKHVYTEKPLARTVSEGRAMVSAVRRAGVVCQVGCQQRSSWEFQRAIALARNGALGTIRSVRVGLPGGGGNRGLKKIDARPAPPELNYEMWLGPALALPYMKERVHFDWRWNYCFGGGILTDWINHHYDIAQVALGVNKEAPLTVSGMKAELPDCPVYDTPTHYSFTVHYANGKVIEVSSRGAFNGRPGVYLEGDKGWVWVNRGTIEHSSPALQSLPLPSDGFVMPGKKDSHRQNFINAIFRNLTPRGPVVDAYYTALVGHLANAAFRAGVSEVKWDAEAERVTNAADAERFMSANYRAPWVLPNV
ncbi:MAG: Gfo/Idh/MocA family oxidoreductase [Verrucomicrobiales bacterium]|nr:Gfo/Idh/MocA family oxidoreductase [Verrucomicrobiales bacterium]